MGRWLAKSARALAFSSIGLLAAAIVLPNVSDEMSGLGLLLLAAGVSACLLTVLIAHSAQLAQRHSPAPESMRAPVLIGYLSLGVMFLLWAGGETPKLREPFQVAESSAIRSVRTLVSAESRYAAAYPETGFACHLSELGPPTPNSERSKAAAGLIDADLVVGTVHEYNFMVQCGADRHSYQISAVPVKDIGHRAYCADESGVIKYASDGASATCLKSGAVLQ